MADAPDLSKISAANLVRAIAVLRARGDHAAADHLAAHLPPAHGPLPHLGAGDPPEPFSPNDPGAPDPSVPGLPKRVPQPDNPMSRGSLPPRMTKAFDPTSPLDWATANGRADVSAPDSFPVATVPDHDPSASRRLGCVYLTLPRHAADRIVSLANQIPDHDLAEDGREDRPHVTALYGIHDPDPVPVMEVLKHFRPVKLRLRGVSVFPGVEHDVVKADVESDAVHRLNAALRSLPHTNAFPVFVPHATIAYVRPGLGAVYAARFSDALDVPCEAGTAVYSDHEKTKHHIPLGRTLTVEKAMSYLDASAGGALVGPSKRRKRTKIKRNRTALVCKAALAELAGGGFEGATLGEQVERSGPRDAEEFVFGTKAFDESNVSREKAAHDGKRPGEFAPRSEGGKSSSPNEPAFHHSQLSDEQREALEAVARLFPRGIAHLLDHTGRVDEVTALGKEPGTTTADHMARSDAARAKWDEHEAELQKHFGRAGELDQLSAADDDLNEVVNRSLFEPPTRADRAPFSEIITGDDFRDNDDESANDDEIATALDNVGSALESCENGDLPDHSEIETEDDLRGEHETDSDSSFPGVDAYDSPEDMADDYEAEADAHEGRAGAVAGSLQKKEAAHRLASSTFRDSLRRDLTAIAESCRDALAIPEKQWKAAGGSDQLSLVKKLQATVRDLLAKVGAQ